MANKPPKAFPKPRLNRQIYLKNIPIYTKGLLYDILQHGWKGGLLACCTLLSSRSLVVCLSQSPVVKQSQFDFEEQPRPSPPVLRTLLPVDKSKRCPAMCPEWLILPQRSTSANQVTHKCQYRGKGGKAGTCWGGHHRDTAISKCHTFYPPAFIPSYNFVSYKFTSY